MLSEKHSLDGQVAISNKLYSNQSVFVYDKSERLSLLQGEHRFASRYIRGKQTEVVSYKGRGFLLQVPIYGKDKKDHRWLCPNLP